ncbi:MAG: hypothetical protein ACKVWV_15090 [Planctomycetota bacterium]
MVPKVALILALVASVPAASAAFGSSTGFQISSKVTFASMPDRPHMLDATYSSTARARLWVGRDEAGVRKGSSFYRSGDSVWEWNPKESKSTELQGDARVALLLSLELRRAAFLWPDAFEWKVEGNERYVELPSVGSLRAAFAQPTDRAPREIAAFNVSGTAIEKMKVVTRRELHGRAWPARIELWQGEALLWTEDVESVDTAARWIDSAFLPPDRRPTPREPATPTPIQERELPSYCGRQFDLPAGCDWESALDSEARERAAWDKRLRDAGMELEPRVTLILSADARPAAFVLRLAKIPASAVEGFVVKEPQRGVASLVSAFGDVTKAKLAELGTHLPAGARADTAYVRLPFGERPPKQVLLVLPISARR